MKKVLYFLGIKPIFKREAWGRFFITTAIIALVIVGSGIFCGYSFLKKDVLRKELSVIYPEHLILEMKKGLLTASGIEMPYFFVNEDNENNTKIFIDTTKEISLDLLDEHEVNQGLIITKNGILIKKNTGEIRLIPFPKEKDFDFTLTKQSALMESANITSKIPFSLIFFLSLLSFGFVYIGLSIVYLFNILIVSTLVLVYGSITKKTSNFEFIFNAVVVVAPLVMLVDLILGLYGFGQFFFIFVSTFLVIVAMYSELKEKNIEEKK